MNNNTGVIERREVDDRRVSDDRRDHLLVHNPAFRLPAWRDQQLQYVLRFIILFLGIAYFNLGETNTGLWLSLSQLNTYFVFHGLITALCYWHATQHKISLTRFRFTILVDVIGVSIATLNDPVILPPCMLAYILIVLGNGMRYGMRLFRESLLICLFAAMLVMTFRYMLMDSELGAGLLFMNIFGLIILLYAYVLMGRLEKSRLSLENLSQKDELTGLLNRRALHEKMNHFLMQCQHDKQAELVVIFADLDNFKHINDTHGHSAGDLVLKTTAEILDQSVRDVDVVARYGGDEFVIIMPETSISVVEIIASRIQSLVQEWAKNNSFEFDISLGIGSIPRHGDNLDDVLKAVDDAMYHAKTNHGPGGLCYATS